MTSIQLRMKRPTKGLVLIAAVALVAASCGGDDSASESSTSVGGDITISDAWARTSPMSVTVGAVYMDIVSAAGDELLGASVDSSIAATTEIHETVVVDMSDEAEGDTSIPADMTGDTMAGHSSGAMSGEMTMQPVESVVLRAGETIKMMPGGYHIMLLDLAAPLEVGQTFDVTLTFAKAGSIVVSVEVRDEAP